MQDNHDNNKNSSSNSNSNNTEEHIVEAEIISETQDTHESSSQDATNAQSNSVHQDDVGDNENDLKSKLLSADHWLRFVFMVLFVVIAVVTSYVAALLIVVQFIFALVKGESDKKLQSFGANLSQYVFQILSFLTYNSEEKPFPFSDFPEVEIVQKDDE